MQIRLRKNWENRQLEILFTYNNIKPLVMLKHFYLDQFIV